MSEDSSVQGFLDALASSAPTPGGGAASALTAALAAALAEMVGQLTVGRKKFQDVEPAVRGILAKLAHNRAALLRLVDEDARAYGQVAAAYALPRSTDHERAVREEAIQQALLVAMQPPERIGEVATNVLRLAGEIATIGNPSVASDAGCAAILAEAAIRCADLNVMANVVLLREEEVGSAARARVTALEADAHAVLDQTLATVRERMGE